MVEGKRARRNSQSNSCAGKMCMPQRLRAWQRGQGPACRFRGLAGPDLPQSPALDGLANRRQRQEVHNLSKENEIRPGSDLFGRYACRKQLCCCGSAHCGQKRLGTSMLTTIPPTAANSLVQEKKRSSNGRVCTLSATEASVMLFGSSRCTSMSDMSANCGTGRWRGRGRSMGRLRAMRHQKCHGLGPARQVESSPQELKENN